MNNTLFLTDRQLAARWGIARSSLWLRVKMKQCPPPFHFGRSARFARAEIEAHERAIGAART